VDAKAPLMQVHPPVHTQMAGRGVLQVRWTAVDAHLLPRPIELAYRLPPDDTWTPITADAIANTGQYDWRYPAELSGAITVRVTATDKGGHRSSAESEVVELRSFDRVERVARQAADDEPPHSSAAMRAEAARLYEQGLALERDGELHRAVRKYRRAIELDPGYTACLVALGRTYGSAEEWSRATQAYELALKLEPKHRDALFGAARADVKRMDYSSAARRLQRILLYNPSDAEAWLQLGDLAVHRNDNVRARECYQKARTVEPNAGVIVEHATRMLDLMNELSRSYRGGDDHR